MGPLWLADQSEEVTFDDHFSSKGTIRTSSRDTLEEEHESGAPNNNKMRNLDKYGFILNMDSHGNVYEAKAPKQARPPISEVKRTERREQKWNTTMNSWERRRPKLLQIFIKGKKMCF